MLECKGYGRELLIQFSCYRCKKTQIETLESASARSEDHYDYINHIRLPKGWSEERCNSVVLCDECTIKLQRFLKGEKV